MTRTLTRPVQPRILVAETSELQLERVSFALREAGNRVAPLSRVEALLPLALAFKPHVLVMATHAPEFASAQMGRRFQTLTRNAVPVIYLVDAPDPELRRYCLEKGRGVDALSKPLEMRELCAKVSALVRLGEGMMKVQEDSSAQPLATVRDGLTGVFQRRALMAFIGQELRRGERYGNNFSLVVIRLNGLERYSITDSLVLRASEVLRETVREADVVARMGEGTFGLLLPEMPVESLPEFCKRLAERFEQVRVAVEGHIQKISVTLGVASFPEVVGTPLQLVGAATLDLKRSRAQARTELLRLSLS